MANVRLLLELKEARFGKRKPVWVSPDDRVIDAQHKMVEERVRSVLVLLRNDGEQMLFGQLQGILTAWDCIVSLEREHRLAVWTRVREIMTWMPHVEFVTPETSLEEAVIKFEKHRHLPVVEGDKIVDVISDMDLIYALQTHGWKIEDTARGATIHPT